MIGSELWLPVVGFPSYEVSNLGRVRRVGPAKSGTTFDGKVLKPMSNGKGYLFVAPVREGKNHHRYVHRLVAEAFFGPIPNGYEVNHRDCDKENNASSNLEYVTHASNMRHSHLSGRVPKGSEKSQAKLSEEDVADIRFFSRCGARAARLAEAWEISPTTVHGIVTGKHWKHVG